MTRSPMNRHAPTLSRRRVLQSGIAAAAYSVTARSPVHGATANERLQVGVIGLGSRGFNLIDELLKHNDARIVAVCDVDEFHYRDRPWGQGKAYGRKPAREKIESHDNGPSTVDVTADYRHITGRDDIDAVVVATPDHWHAHCTLEALRQGKDVYCEKPITHTFAEGQMVYRQVALEKAIFQTGSQQRSGSEFRRAVELVRNGYLGSLQRIEIGLPPGYETPQGDPTVTAPPQHLDYDWWCGPSPKLPYMRARHHRWWRGHRAYGGGVLMDWIGHHNDIAHWAMNVDQSGPLQVEAVGWTEPKTDVYNTPHQYEIRCRYENKVETSIGSVHPVGAKFIGEKGWIFVTRGKLQASDARWSQPDFDPGEIKVYHSDDHMRNFLDGIRSRKPCIAPAETAHRSITPGHLGYVSHQLARPLRWDANAERVIDDEEANQLLQQSNYRSPWGHP